MTCIGQHILAGFDGPSVTDEVRDLILKERVLGFTLFKWNIESAEQLCALNEELKALAAEAGYELLLAVDQEGGRVERLPAPFNRVPSMRRWAEVCGRKNSLEPLRELGKLLGREVSLAGFNLDFAPVVDVDLNIANPVIGDRAFSSNAEAVYEHARAVIQGLVGENVIPCLKHFPGHGATHKDSHFELPVDDRTLSEILAIDVLPYRRLIAEGLAPTLMTAHVLYPQIDPDNPATLSHKIVTELLRDQLAYDGVVFSDDLLMKAMADNYDLAKVSEKFFLIGGDAVLVCKEPQLTRDIIGYLKSVVESSGGDKLSARLKESKLRLGNLKSRFLPRFPAKSPVALEAIAAKHKRTVENYFA